MENARIPKPKKFGSKKSTIMKRRGGKQGGSKKKEVERDTGDPFVGLKLVASEQWGVQRVYVNEDDE